MIKRLGLDFPVLSDRDQRLQKAFGVQNPDTQELALHAVFVINQDREVVYRKIAGRRPLSQEILDSIDYARGQYPLGDAAPERGDIPVAFPTNNFQALIEIATNARLPNGIVRDDLNETITRRQQGDLDEATIAYRDFAASVTSTHTQEQLLSTAAWLTLAMVSLPDQAIITGRALSETLSKERRLRTAPEVDTVALKNTQRELEQLRSLIKRNAVKWRLRAAKTTLRGYRELSIAAFAKPEAKPEAKPTDNPVKS